MRLPLDNRQRGVVMIYIVAVLLVVLGIVSFAVDYGRVQLAKTQLRVAADSAARAAVTALGTTLSAVQDRAVQYAALNTCDGVVVSVDSNQDVEFLDWNTTTRTYSVLTGSARNYANAVRVTCRRTTARNNPVPLTFSKVLGRSTCDVMASSIAAIVPPGYGLVGLNSISLKGNSSASYWSSTGTFAGNAGNIASNGNITSTGSATVQGTLWTLSGATVSGITSNARRTLPAPLSYSNRDPSPYSTSNNDNVLMPAGAVSASSVNVSNNKTFSIPAGTYYFNNFTLGNNSILNFQGPTVFYIYGTINISGQLNTSSSTPANLKIYTINNPSGGAAPGSITISSSSATYADIYAPSSDITLSGSGALYGAIIGKSITMTGTSDIYYDLSLSGGTGVIQVVK